jgi:outer membrane protein
VQGNCLMACRKLAFLVYVTLVTVFCAPVFPQETVSPVSPPNLTLDQAETTALANQPRLLAAQLRARAYAKRIVETRSGYMPQLAFNATGVRVADTGTSTAAGNITTSAISDRFAYGGNLAQLVTDFGRTSALVSSARATTEAQNDIATLTRAQVRLNVIEAYYRVLGSEAVLRAAKAAQTNRQLISRRLSTLADSELRSTLDVNFAKVLESEADLAVVRAESTVAQRRVKLATAMGISAPVTSQLQEPSAPPDSLPPDAESYMKTAGQYRADLNAAKSQQLAANKFALSERRMSYPTLNILAAAGRVPFHDHTLHDDYAAAGFNLNIPIFNGGLFAARREEAELEASARTRDVQEIQLQVTEQVRDAWYQADEAYRSLDVTARLVVQSKEALRLAQDRYEAGLGSIVELNEAQLNETSAEITDSDSTYTYLLRRAELDFAAGLLN